MGLADITRRALDWLTDGSSYGPSRFSDDSHLEQITLDDWLGALPDHVTVTRKNAMQLAPVAASRNTIATTVGRLPMYAKRGGVRVPTQPALLGQVERGVPLATTMTWTADALFFQSCTWWHVLERDAYGWPVWCEWVARDRAGLDSSGRLITIDRATVRPEDIIRFDSPLGHGFLHNAKRIIQRSIAIDIAAAHAEDNPVPTVELHDTRVGGKLSQTEVEELLEAWSSARRKRGAAYTPNTIELKAHGQHVAQLLIDGRKALGLDLLRQASMPAWAASTAIEGATMTYDNRSLRNWELIDLTLAPYFEAIAGRLSLNDVTPRGTDVEYELDELTREPMKTRFEAYEIGKKAGFVDNAWIAEQEGWASVPADKPEEAA